MTASARRFAWEIPPVALVPIYGTPLSMETTDGPWCVVRYLNGKMCGPLSMLSWSGGLQNYDSPVAGGFGFPEGGEIGVVEWFESEADARSFADSLGDLGHVENRPTPREALHFWAREYFHYNGTEHVLYDGGDYRTARAAVWLRRGEVNATKSNPGYHKVSLMCRPAGEPRGDR